MSIEWSADAFHRAGVKASPVKILLKTKDDHWLLRKWYSHHAQLVGSDNIIIFDHASTHPLVNRFYEEIEKETPVFRHDAPVDDVHDSSKFPALYRQLNEVCSTFIFLDTDEYLSGMASPSSLIKPEGFMEAVNANLADDADYAPTLWIDNAFKSEKSFIMRGQSDLEQGIKWGKPLMRASRVTHGTSNHNCQVASRSQKVSKVSRLVLFHMKNLLPQQRIEANVRKLKTFNLVPHDAALDEILQMDLREGSPSRWVNEIKQLIEAAERPPETGEIMIDGDEITFARDDIRHMMRDFYENPAAIMTKSGLVQ